MACIKCHTIKKWKYRNDSKEKKCEHLRHIQECIHYANRYLIRFVSGKCNLKIMDQIHLLHSMMFHPGIRKYHIYRNQTLFKRVFLIMTNIKEEARGLLLMRKQQIAWISKDKQMLSAFNCYLNDMIGKKKRRMAFLLDLLRKYDFDFGQFDNLHAQIRSITNDKKLNKFIKTLLDACNDMHRKCGNLKCTKDYMLEVYGCHIDSAVERDKFSLSVLQHWDTKRYTVKIGKEWKLCKQCKTTYYCSRRCQKISWKQVHKKQCKKLH
eukprot:447574_1